MYIIVAPYSIAICLIWHKINSDFSSNIFFWSDDCVTSDLFIIKIIGTPQFVFNTPSFREFSNKDFSCSGVKFSIINFPFSSKDGSLYFFIFLITIYENFL